MMEPGHGRFRLGAAVVPGLVGLRADLAARVSGAVSLGAYGQAAYDWRLKSLDYQAGLMLGVDW